QSILTLTPIEFDCDPDPLAFVASAAVRTRPPSYQCTRSPCAEGSLAASTLISGSGCSTASKWNAETRCWRSPISAFSASIGQALHLLRDDGEGLSVAPRARRLDRRVEREELRLVGDLLDDARDGADLLAAPAQCLDGAGRDPDGGHDLVHACEGVADDAAAF